MTLPAPPLVLGSGPRGVSEARRWTRETVAEMGRDDIAECAELGVSELVTNALLHAEAPVEVRLGGTADHPRFEVRDNTTTPPVLPSASSFTVPDVDDLGATDDLDALEQLEEALSTVGRGLALVSRVSTAWGTDIEHDGKVVWFEPSDSVSETEGPDAMVTGEGERSSTRRAEGAGVRIQLLAVPASSYRGFVQYYRELQREIRLLALTHEAEYPLATGLSALFESLRLPAESDPSTVRRLDDRDRIDVQFSLEAGVAHRFDDFVDLLDLVDEFSRAERLLSLARTSEQRDFGAWMLNEIAHQTRGGKPLAWTDESSSRLRRSEVS